MDCFDSEIYSRFHNSLSTWQPWCTFGVQLAVTSLVNDGSRCPPSKNSIRNNNKNKKERKKERIEESDKGRERETNTKMDEDGERGRVNREARKAEIEGRGKGT